MVVNDLDLLWPGVRPDKAESELVVDALISETGPVLAMAVPPERLQAIARRDLQIVEASGGVEDGELAERHRSEAFEAAPWLPFKEGLGVAATKRPDHTVTLPPPDVGTPGSGAGRRRSRADMAAWIACVPPLASATPVSPPPGSPHAPAPAQDVARRILGSPWWAGFTFNGITAYGDGHDSLIGGDRVLLARRWSCDGGACEGPATVCCSGLSGPAGTARGE